MLFVSLIFYHCYIIFHSTFVQAALSTAGASLMSTRTLFFLRCRDFWPLLDESFDEPLPRFSEFCCAEFSKAVFLLYLFTASLIALFIICPKRVLFFSLVLKIHFFYEMFLYLDFIVLYLSFNFLLRGLRL